MSLLAPLQTKHACSAYIGINSDGDEVMSPSWKHRVANKHEYLRCGTMLTHLWNVKNLLMIAVMIAVLLADWLNITGQVVHWENFGTDSQEWWQPYSEVKMADMENRTTEHTYNPKSQRMTIKPQPRATDDLVELATHTGQKGGTRDKNWLEQNREKPSETSKLHHLLHWKIDNAPPWKELFLAFSQ